MSLSGVVKYPNGLILPKDEKWWIGGWRATPYAKIDSYWAAYRAKDETWFWPDYTMDSYQEFLTNTGIYWQAGDSKDIFMCRTTGYACLFYEPR